MLLAAAPLAAQSPPELSPAPSDTAVAFFVSGGTWETGHSHGYYRLLVTRDAERHLPSRLLIEWIETTPGHAFVRVFRVVSVITEPWQLRRPQFEVAPPRIVRARVAGFDEHSGLEESWQLTLGPPGLFSVSPVRR